MDFKLTQSPVIPLIKAPEHITGKSATFSLRQLARISPIKTKDTCHGEGLTSRVYFTYQVAHIVHTARLEAVPRAVTAEAVRTLEEVRSQMIKHWNACYDEGEEHLYVARDAQWSAS